MNCNVIQCTIDNIIESLNTYGCTILKCSYIGEYVVGYMDIEIIKNKQLYHIIGDNIIVTDETLNNVVSISDLSNIFKEEYQENIGKKKFSKNYGKWTCFTDSDMIRINEIK